MLPARNYKKCLIKPLPLESIKKTKSPTVQVSPVELSEEWREKRKRRKEVPKEDNQPTEPLEDYQIEESDDEDKISFQSSQLDVSGIDRRSFTSILQRSMVNSPSNLKDLLRPTPLDVRKRKRRQTFPSTPVLPPSTPTKAYDGIDESSPIKKVRGITFADQSCIFITRHKKSQHSKRQEKGSSSFHVTLADQMRDLLEREKTNRTIWRHSVTSQLKNKFKEMAKGKDTMTLKLFNFHCKFHCGFVDGLITETTVNTFKPDETVRLIFPSLVCEHMGLTNGLTVRLISPWAVVTINDQKFVINPFWISVIKRHENSDHSQATTTNIIKEETLIEWTCPCREPNATIDSLDCNLVPLQTSSQP